MDIRDEREPTSVVQTVDISVVVPVYRSAATLPALHERVARAVEQVTLSFELILVEDCGGDDSWATIEELARKGSGATRSTYDMATTEP